MEGTKYVQLNISSITHKTDENQKEWLCYVERMMADRLLRQALFKCQKGNNFTKYCGKGSLMLLTGTGDIT